MNITTIADKIRERALGDPDRLCIVTETDAMTYAQVWQESLRNAGALSALGLKKGDFPIAEEISATELSIPMYYGMTQDEIGYVINAINSFC